MTPANNSPEHPNLSKDATLLMQALANVATRSDVRLRFTLEVEPLAVSHEPQVRVMDPDQYISLLESATRELSALKADRAGVPSGSAVASSIEASIEDQLNRVAQTTVFWHPNRLFDDRGWTVSTDEGEIDVVEIPRDYLAVGAVEPGKMEEILWAELEYIEAQIPDPSVVADMTAAARAETLSINETIREIKRILKEKIEPEIRTTATSLSSFQKNWQHALEQLSSQTVVRADEVLSSLLGLIKWDQVANWLKVLGNKLPKEILNLSLPFQQLIRWLFGRLDGISRFIWNKFHIDLDLKDQALRLVKELRLLRTRSLSFAVNAIWQTAALTQEVDREVTKAVKRLRLPKKTARLHAKQKAPLQACLKECEETIDNVVWDMFKASKTAWIAGLIMKLEPGPSLEIALGGGIVVALVLLVILGRDALWDGSRRRGRYRGIRTLALTTLETLKREAVG